MKFGHRIKSLNYSIQQTTTPHYWTILIAGLPALILLPAVLGTFPVGPHFAVELAGYFQTKALLADPLQSWTYQTPSESSSALHLHSILSAPLLAAGITTAGRVISLLAAIAGVVLTVHVTRRLLGTRAGLLAGALLWLHPLYGIFATRWWSESLSIALTAGAVAAALYYHRRRTSAWYVASLSLLALAITNHLWEAAIALPLTVIFALGATTRRDWLRVTGPAVTVAGTIAVVKYVQSLQPAGHNLTKTYAVYNHPETLFSVRWLAQGGMKQLTPLAYAMTLVIPALCAASIFLAVKYVTGRQFEALVIGSWLASGASILVLLPRGWVHHPYYAWGVLVPLAISGGWLIADTVRDISQATRTVSVRQLGYGVLTAVFVLGVVLNAGVYRPEFGGINRSPPGTLSEDEVERIGTEVSELGATQANQIVFVGDWGYKWTQPQYYKSAHISRVLVASGVTVQGERRMDDVHDETGPRVAPQGASVSDCRVRVIKTGGSVSVESC